MADGSARRRPEPAAAPSAQEIAERIAAAGGRARFAGRVALGVYADRDIPAWRESVTGTSRVQVRSLTTLAVAESAPLVVMLLLLPQLAELTDVSTFALGAAIVLPLLASLLVVVPASGAGSGSRRVVVALACGISLAVAGMAAGQLRSPMLFALLLSVRAILAAFMWASARPLLVDSVVPEARARVLARWRLGWLLGAALGAAGAGIATEGPRVGVSIAITAVSVIAVLISLMSLSAKDPGPGGVEAQRLRVLFGDDVADDLIAPTAGAAALGRVARTEAARTTLTGYVAVGFASIGVLAPAQRLLVERGTDVTFGIAALAICAALLVAVIPLFVAGRGVERLRRQSPDLGAAPAFTGIMLAVLGCVGLWLAPAAVIPAALCVCVTGAIVAAVALDAVVFTVVAPGDRPAAAALTGLSTASGAVLGYALIVLSAERVGIGPSFAVATLPLIACAFASRRPAQLATAGLDSAVGADAEEAELTELAADGTAVIPVLSARNIDFSYGSVQALFGVSLQVSPGELVAILGPNGVGKTTLLRVLSGLAKPSAGAIRLDGRDITKTSAPERVAVGLSQIVGGQAVFGTMTVAENLRMYGYSLGKNRRAIESGIEQAYAVFPRLAERRSQLASTLSGGEQQMLGLAKALILAPRILLIDEFSLGLAPVVVGELMATVRSLNAAGTAVLLVEQSVNVALSLVDRVYFMEKGRITYSGSAAALRADPELVARLSMGGAHAEDLAGGHGELAEAAR